MTIREVVKLLDAEILCGEDRLDTEIHTACGSDMMSDVLAYVKDQSVLLTGLLNPQVVRTAEMMDMLCIVFVRGKRPEQPVIDLAREKGIVLLSTEKRLFVACGILYTNGLGGGDMGCSAYGSNYDVDGTNFSSAGNASESVKRTLKQMGVDAASVRRVAIAMYEG